ncbi:MAG: alkyl hydroperoxide reductase [Rhodospirillales bacterium]
MTLEDIRAGLPDYAKDLKLNLGSTLKPEALSEQQVWGAALASALAARNATLTAAVAIAAREKLSAEALKAAKTAAALMSMNNVYYRFTHLVGDSAYQKLPARLRMNAMSQPGVDKVDFELWSLAVSAVNGCGLCIEAHERELKAKGATKVQVQDAVRIAATLHAVAAVLDGEAALEEDGEALAAA